MLLIFLIIIIAFKALLIRFLKWFKGGGDTRVYIFIRIHL